MLWLLTGRKRTARLVEMDRKIWSKRLVADQKDSRDSQGFSVEPKQGLANCGCGYKYFGHPLRFRNFPAPSRFARPFTQRRPSTSSPLHIATRRIKQQQSLRPSRVIVQFSAAVSLSFGRHRCERDFHLRSALTSGLGKLGID